MRNYLALLISLSFLVACGGGGGAAGSTGTTIPVGSVSGTSFDGLILGGTVSVYDFTTGAKGALLGQTTSDGQGLYSLSLQVESRPVLVEITGGYYVEEAGAVGGAITQVLLGENHLLTAVANYTTGSSLKVAVTTYTHLAAGLAAYQISQGTAVPTAINDANTRASSLVGVNILTTIPKEITDVGNASATLTPELRYGFLAGAISMWTYNHAPKGIAAHSAPYDSIDFAQLLYQDISADGLLDGFGFDSTGALAQLSFGTTPLGPEVYRLELGISLMKMAGHANNKTGLDGAKVLSFAQAYIANTDTMYSGVAPVPFAAFTVNITTPASNAWVANVANIEATVQSPFGIGMVELLVDNVVVATSNTSLATHVLPVTTNNYADGAYIVTVRATDLGGFVRTTSQTVLFDNTWPTATAVVPFAFAIYQWSRAVVCVTESGAGVSSVINLEGGEVGVSQGNGCWAVDSPNLNRAAYRETYIVKDKVGHCSAYWASANGVYGGQWALKYQTNCQ